MDEALWGYLLVLGIGTVLIVIIGKVLIHSGAVMLTDAESDRASAGSVSTLVGVLFYLVALGLLALVATVPVPADSGLQAVVTKLGIVLLVLGGLTALTIGAFSAIRGRRAEQRLVEASARAQAEWHHPAGR